MSEQVSEPGSTDPGASCRPAVTANKLLSQLAHLLFCNIASSSSLGQSVLTQLQVQQHVAEASAAGEAKPLQQCIWLGPAAGMGRRALSPWLHASAATVSLLQAMAYCHCLAAWLHASAGRKQHCVLLQAGQANRSCPSMLCGA